MFKILCTGNPDKPTLAKGIKQIFPDADFIYLSAGYNLNTIEGYAKFREKIKSYNVFINASRIGLGVQKSLLKITRQEWTSGHVFNIGSVTEYKHFARLYPEVSKDKLELRDLSIEYCNEQFKTTHVVMGGIQDESTDSDVKLNPVHVANVIKWILESKVIHVPIIGIENDYWNPNWSKIKYEVCG